MTLPLTAGAVEAFRAELTEVATRLFVREGPDALSLRNLAREAGVSRSTPYGYFESKLDIVDSIRAAGFDRLTERCRAALAAVVPSKRRRNELCLAQMRELGWAVVCFAKDEPQIYRLMFSRPVFAGDVSAPVLAAVERFRAVSRPPLEEALRRRLVRGDADTLRRTTWAAFHGLITLHLDGHFASQEQLEADFEALNQIIGNGILVKKRRTR